MRQDRSLAWISVAIVVLLLGIAQLPRADEPQDVSILGMMSLADYKACGLEKLTTEELQNLELWIQSTVVQLVSALREDAAPGPTGSIESRISGDFEGWDGETVFVLDNGQIWQQSSYAYHYHYAYRPEVLIYRVGARYKMKVEGVSESIYVHRLK